jgi:hypothetical protein
MARITGLIPGAVSILRSIAGVIAADSGTLTDANIPPAGAIDCTGFDTLLVGVEIDAGSSPTMTIEALFYDPQAADGSRWHRLFLGAAPGVTATALANETTGALASGAFAELRVFGAKQVFFRVTAITNAASTTASRILAMPGQTRNVKGVTRS